MQAYVEYFQTHGQEYVHMIWQHLYLSLLAVGIAAAVGIPCGILSLRAPRIKKILTTGFSVLRIIPSLAVLVILIPIMGVGGETGTGSIGDSGNPTNSDTDNAGIFTGSRFSAGSGRCHGHG